MNSIKQQLSDWLSQIISFKFIQITRNLLYQRSDSFKRSSIQIKIKEEKEVKNYRSLNTGLKNYY